MIGNIIQNVIANLISDRMRPDLPIQNNVVVNVDCQKNSKDNHTKFNNARSKRLNTCLSVLSGNQLIVITPEIVAMETRAESIAVIEKYFSGELDPPSKWLEIFASKYHINIVWLMTGQGEIFSHRLIPFTHNTNQIVTRLQAENIESILFIKDDSIESVCCIVGVYEDDSFDVIHKYRSWRMSDQTGPTGRSDTVSYFEIVQQLISDRNTINKLWGYIVPKILHDGIIDGTVYPMSNLNYQCSYWFENLSDFDHKRHNQDFYDRFYGPSYAKAQKIIQSQIR